jgi:hypothetical protein
MYEPQREEPAGCRDVWVLTRATLGILMWPVAALIGVLVAVGVAFALLAVHPALALVPIVLVVGGLVYLARRESRQPPEV